MNKFVFTFQEVGELHGGGSIRIGTCECDNELKANAHARRIVIDQGYQSVKVQSLEEWYEERHL